MQKQPSLQIKAHYKTFSRLPSKVCEDRLYYFYSANEKQNKLILKVLLPVRDAELALTSLALAGSTTMVLGTNSTVTTDSIKLITYSHSSIKEKNQDKGVS